MGGVVGGVLGLALIGVLLYYVALRQSSYARVAQGRSVGEEPPKSAVIRRTHTRRETDVEDDGRDGGQPVVEHQQADRPWV